MLYQVLLGHDQSLGWLIGLPSVLGFFFRLLPSASTLLFFLGELTAYCALVASAYLGGY